MEQKTGIFLIGGSAGSISVLLEILPQLRNDLSFPVVVVLHRKAYHESAMDTLLGFYSKIPVYEAHDKMLLKNGRIYLAPADYHLLFETKQQISLDVSEKVNYSRPSIDVTFQSAAKKFQQETTALLLSGANQDGTDGLQFISNCGGRVLVQDPDTAEFDFMPKQTLLSLNVNKILKPGEMASFINHLN
ncbi:chemotaxis protein CheB [Niabella insulamsoli]|uniref:chemotaxis protein CheB n=1 Tax=Niabella insulamsoli TaxID=3144874 RepID=UPI0031FDAE2E